MGMAATVTTQRMAKNPHVPGSRGRKTEYGSTRIIVVCVDNRPHDYLNEGVPEGTTTHPPYVACPRCKTATAPLIGTVGVICDDCRTADAMERIEAFEEESGVQLTPHRPDPIDQRAMHGYRDRCRQYNHHRGIAHPY